jgi:hypothetical protein
MTIYKAVGGSAICHHVAVLRMRSVSFAAPWRKPVDERPIRCRVVRRDYGRGVDVVQQDAGLRRPCICNSSFALNTF